MTLILHIVAKTGTKPIIGAEELDIASSHLGKSFRELIPKTGKAQQAVSVARA
ncbi:MAG: hypothetical protein NXH97_08885 [Rhodobacteraceae bacterium]|nr:hypothetical protein [Paracoccaceae bacterium]